MYHPAVDATHEFPANKEAISGAMESGWVLADTTPETDDSSEPEPKPEPESTPAKKTKPAVGKATADKGDE
jgi:hypothetical protein